MAKKAANKFEERANLMECLGTLYQYAESQREYNCDLDEEGNYVPPKEDSYSYGTYVGWCEVLKILDTLKI